MIVGFDFISDLNLSSQDIFDWEGKPTSLFCLVAGNISADITIVQQTLKNLGKYYHGVFFIDGSLENSDPLLLEYRVKELTKFTNSHRNIVYLHTNVVVVDGIALVGINGWENNQVNNTEMDLFQSKINRYDDVMYLERTLERLQLHVDVKKIIIISNCVPSRQMYFGLNDPIDELYPDSALELDTERKVSKWVFGSSPIMVDTVIDGVRFVNNPKTANVPFYPKRIEIEV